jgi:ABC-type multidrug transport system fused ATPase/permease subunit
MCASVCSNVNQFKGQNRDLWAQRDARSMAMSLPRFILFRRIYSILSPFGRRRLAGIILFNLAQAFLQAATVISFMIFATVITGAEAAAPKIPLIGDALAASTNPKVLWGSLTALVLLAANLLNLAGEYVRSHYSAHTGYLITTGILRTIADRPYSFHLQNNSSLLIKKAHTDVSNFVNGVLAPLLDLNARLLMILFIFGSLVFVDPVIALSLCGVFLFFYFVFFLMARRFWKLLNEQYNLLAKVSYKSIYQFLTGVKPILVHDVRNFFLATYEEAAFRTVRYRSLGPVISNGPRYIIEIIVMGGGVAALTFLFVQGTSIEAMAPTAVSFLYGGYRLLPNLQLMFGTIGSIKTNSHTVDEILADITPEDLRRVHQALPVAGTETLPFKDAISLQSVSFAYGDDQALVLDNVSLQIRRGEKVAFVGPTGSGKSTLIDLILGLHTPVSGCIQIDGEELNSDRLPLWRRRIGYVPQDIFLVDDTLRRNIAFGLKDEEIDEEALGRAVRMAQADEFIFDRKSEGLDTIVGERGVRLSGGQRQRIGLARALYHQPDVLILDEATSALDNATEAAIMDVIDNLSDGLTIITIAHRLSTVRHADRIFLLDRGIIKASGKYDALLDSSEDFRTLAASARGS